MGAFVYQPQNAHRVALDQRALLFHVPTTALFEIDPLEGAVLDFFATAGSADAGMTREQFADVNPAALARCLKSLVELGILSDGGPAAPERPPIAIANLPLTTLVLNVNTGCNLACSYCYKEDLATPAAGERMTLETAVRAIDMLLAESPDRERYNLVFFGGEPLSNLPLIRAVVEHAEARFARLGAAVDFSLTTNATLLTPETVDWLDAQRFGLTVSMDGPKALHDRNRLTIGGKGSYDTVAAKARMLLARYRSRPVGARVTLTAGVTAIEAIFEHLKEDIGFAEVGFSPVTSGPMTAFNLTAEELTSVFAGLKALGRRYRDEAIAGRPIGFSNMHQMMQDLVEGRSKALPCGAGVGMLAVDHAGAIGLCHRFTGAAAGTFGSLAAGIERDRLTAFIEARAERAGKGCATCRIRNLCAGGCYHESYAHFGDPLQPAYHYCELMRDWVDFGIEIYAAIAARAPQFFRTAIAPRRALGK